MLVYASDKLNSLFFLGFKQYISGTVQLIPLQQAPQQTDVTYPKAYTCGFCGKICTAPSHLKRHLLIHTGEKPFTCSVCNASFRLKAHLTRHNLIHIREKLQT